jgi:putative membrane protein
MVSVTDLPFINGFCTLFLVLGFIQIKRGKISLHQKCMITALTLSVLFLISYLIYHSQVGSVPYPHHDWTRPIYFMILIPHIILAAVNVPFIVLLVWRAIQGEFNRHRRLAKWVWPSWVFVSLTGVIIYLMLYHS